MLFLLYLNATEFHVYRCHNSLITLDAHFPCNTPDIADDSTQNMEGFNRYLEQHLSTHPRSLFYLLVESADEDFQRETIPFTRGRERRALIQRKLERFNASPFCTAISLGRDKHGRRDEHILLAALTRPQSLQPWLAVLKQHSASLAGIWSIPLLDPLLLNRIEPSVKRALIVTLGKEEIRQTFIDKEIMHLSRCSRPTQDSGASIVEHCVSEAQRMYQYLIAQHMLDPAEKLIVFVLAQQDHQDLAIILSCHTSEQLQFKLINSDRLNSLLGIARTNRANHRHDATNDAANSAELYLHLLAQKPPREHFAPASETRAYRHKKIRRIAAIISLCLLTILVCALGIVYFLNQPRSEDKYAFAKNRTLAVNNKQDRETPYKTRHHTEHTDGRRKKRMAHQAEIPDRNPSAPTGIIQSSSGRTIVWISGE